MSFYVARPAEPQERLLANATPATRRRFAITARTTHPVAGSNSRSCPQCGSQFGVPDPPPVVHSPPRRPPASPPLPPATAHPPKAGRKGYTSWPPRGPWSRRVPPGHERETRPRSDAFRDAIERRLPELFREAARVRRMREVAEFATDRGRHYWVLTSRSASVAVVHASLFGNALTPWRIHSVDVTMI